MHRIGRLLQLIALVAPLAAIFLELNHTLSLGQMLVAVVSAVCLFYIGRLIEGYGRRPE